MSEEPKPVGRPRKELDAAKIWSEEQGELAQLAKRMRKFLSTQLDLLEKDAEGITNMAARQELAGEIVGMLGQLTKNIKIQMTETQKEPREQDETVDLDKIYKDLTK